jgi:D-alanine-D-alanine ligase
MHDDLVPPDSLEGHSPKEIAEWVTEFDVISALKELGHEVFPLGVGSDLGVIKKAITDVEPDVAFNLLVHFHGVAVYDQHVVSYMELLKKPYTGCNPRGLMLARDKALSKKILAYHRIRVPRFYVVPRGRKVRHPKRMGYPAVVKSVNEEASLGISQASVVTDEAKLKERVEFMHDSFGVDVLVEEYIEGRELCVGMIGNQRPIVYPVWELDLEDLPDGAYKIATHKVKWDLDYQKKYKIRTQRAKGISEEIESEISKTCKRIYRALGLSGYARVDLRLDAENRVYVLEANPNPDLKKNEDFSDSVAATGMSYPEMLHHILNLGLSYQVEWKQ